jgi:23S rRNA (uracil1939-C5)-methyltransferase
MARLADGRVCFVAGALPGELCKVAVTFTKKDFARGHVVEVLEGANPDRVEARCPLYGKCGGCSLQHLDSEKQAEYPITRLEYRSRLIVRGSTAAPRKGARDGSV